MEIEKLHPEELNLIEKVANNILAPISGKVSIDPEPIKSHWWSGEIGAPGREWDEHWYRITTKSDKGECRLLEIINPGLPERQGWAIACQVFFRLDNDIRGTLANNLWPKDNNWLPDYARFLPQEDE